MMALCKSDNRVLKTLNTVVHVCHILRQCDWWFVYCMLKKRIGLLAIDTTEVSVSGKENSNAGRKVQRSNFIEGIMNTRAYRQTC